MDNLPPVILASASPRRSELLTSMDIEFEVVPSHVEELLDGYDFIPDLCEANARIKAEPIAEATKAARIESIQSWLGN